MLTENNNVEFIMWPPGPVISKIKMTCTYQYYLYLVEYQILDDSA